MAVEGRGLSSRQTQDVVRDLEIGKPNNSETCSKAADGVARESEGGSRLSVLRPVRQDQPRRHSGACLRPVPLQQGRARRRRPGFCGHRSIRGRAMAGCTGACAQAGDLPAGANQTSVYTEGQRQTQTAGSVRDRVCMTAALLVLEPIFEADLPPEIYAYRAGRNAQQAVVEVEGLVFRGHPDVVDADLADYFGSIPHTDLLSRQSRNQRGGSMVRRYQSCREPD